MKFHRYGNIDPFKIPENADRLLNEYWDIAERLKIKTCLYFGTCLGFVRDGGYIIGDHDIDVMVLERIDELIAGLIKNEFVFQGRRKVFLKYDIMLDIYGGLCHQKFLQSFDKVTYKGRIYNVPHPVEEYLRAKYGDWKTKKLRKVWEGENE